MLTEKDLIQLEKNNLSIEKVKSQIQNFIDGFPFCNIQKPATLNDGIININSKNEQSYIDAFEKSISKGLDIGKFVPASGAASRMFKDLFSFINKNHTDQIKEKSQEPYSTFFNELSDFAFYEDLNKILIKNNTEDPGEIIGQLLLENGLNYGELPKGLLKFHKYDDYSSTPMEEHFKEGIAYALKSDKSCSIHFTVSPEHHDRFKELADKLCEKYEKQHGVKLSINFSFQKKSTDTIAVDMENKPFYQEDGTILFRPGGHGALIENLNDLEYEMVFIKNIDNVIQEHLLADTIKYKKVIGGVLINKKEGIFKILKGLDNQDLSIQTNSIEEGFKFLNNELKQSIPSAIENGTINDQINYIKNFLNKPIRVCGMVKNEGEPGGGPFWVKQSNGNVTLQIVEGPQIDPNDFKKQALIKQSTHFNPVDLVCYLKDYKGDKFDLTNFIDHDAGFISEKSLNGRELKALELPGLWNGAMANWITFFVEVPITTFNPVKTVMDLLRPQHQPKLELQK